MQIPLLLHENGREASLLEDIVFEIPLPPPYGCDGFATADGKCTRILVPKGFVTDFASSPRWAWSFAGPIGKHAAAAILHDYLYYYQIGNRSWADKIFLLLMKEAGVKWIQRNLMWGAVRLFGHRVWAET